MMPTTTTLEQPQLPELPPWSSSARAIYLPLLSVALAMGDMERVEEICLSPDIPDTLSSSVGGRAAGGRAAGL